MSEISDTRKPDEALERELIQAKLNPAFSAGCSISNWGLNAGNHSLFDLVEGLKESMATDKDGSQALRAQAATLDALFHKLTTLALSQENLAAIDSLLKLALKAQSQSRRTAEALASITNPPNLFAKQVNVGHAVQVNNGSDPDKSFQESPNEVSSEDEPRPEPQAIEAHSSVETLGEFLGSEDATREGPLVKECVQGRTEAEDA